MLIVIMTVIALMIICAIKRRYDKKKYIEKHIEVCFAGYVVGYYDKTRTADIQPFSSLFPMLYNVPVKSFETGNYACLSPERHDGVTVVKFTPGDVFCAIPWGKVG